MKSQVLGVALLGVALLAGQARASIITINFDDLANLATVGNHYPSVTFSAGLDASGGQDVVLAFFKNPPFHGSVPNEICTGPVGGPVDCMADITLTFTNPVSNLTFDAYGNQTTTGNTFAVAD